MERLLSADEVLERLLDEVGATGQAKIVRGALMIQAEEKSRWMFHGVVEDTAAAEEVICEYFS
jgi:hypothetical protein